MAKTKQKIGRYGIPRSLNIKGTRYRIIVAPEVLMNGSPVEGLCDYPGHALWVKVNDPTTMWSTLLHEIYHAGLFETGFAQTSLDMDLHHLIVENLSTITADLIIKCFFSKKKG